VTWYRWEKGALVLKLRVQPKASRDGFVGPHGESYRVRITAPPVEGKANACLIRFLAKSFGVPKRNVTLVSGKSSRNKTFRIEGPQRLPLPVDTP